MKLSEETRAFAAALAKQLYEHVDQVSTINVYTPHALCHVANCITETVKAMDAAEAVDEAVRAGVEETQI